MPAGVAECDGDDLVIFLAAQPSIFNLADSATGASAYSTIHFSNAGAYDCDTAVADVARAN